MRLKSIIHFYISFFLASFCSLTLAAELPLNGMAIHTDLGKEQFIGALYSTTFSDTPEKLLTSAQPMRMELRITSPDGITTRRFSRWWIEGMAINNSRPILTEQADNMVKFDSLFKGRFAPNDTIVFNSEPGKGINITINDALLGNIADDKFFSLLLSGWIGKVPLSSDYKDGILKNGKVSAELKDRFNKIKPSKERSIEVAAWSKIKSAADIAAEKEKEKEAKDAKDAAAKLANAQTSSTDNTKQLAAQKIEQAKAEAAKAEAAKLVAQKASAAASAAKTSTDDEEDAQPVLTAQTLLARQFFVSDQLKKIYANVSYPKKALEKRQTGNVRITVVINRQGSLLKATIAQSSDSEELDAAALEAVNKTSFTPIPDSITGPTFELAAPLRFTLQPL